MKRSIFAYNQHCRKILADKRVLSYLLKISMTEFKDLSLQTIESFIESEVLVEGNTHRLFASNNEVYLYHGKIVFDVLFALRLPNSSDKIDMLVNVELQNEDTPKSKEGKPYPLLKRACFYGSVAIVEEKGVIFTGDNYQDMKKITTIWINTDVRKERKNTIKRYKCVESEHIGTYYKDEKNHYDFMEIIVLNLGEEDTLIELGPLNELFVRTNSAQEKLRNLKEKYGIEVYEETKGDVENMCNLGEALVEKTRRKALIEGRNEGKIEEKLQIVKILMEKLNHNYEFVAKLLDMSDEEIVQYREHIFQ